MFKEFQKEKKQLINGSFLKLCLESIFPSEKGANISHFSPIFGFQILLHVFDILRGQKTLFFKKWPNNGL